MHNSGAPWQQRTTTFSYWAASSDQSRRADLCQLKVSEWHICISKPITKTLWITLGIHEFNMENGSLPVVLRQSKTPFLKDPNTLLMTQVVTFPARSSLHYCTWLSVFLLQKTWSVLLTCLYECLFRDVASALPIIEETISQTSHSLRGRRLKAKGKGALGARETRGGAQNLLSFPFQTPATQAKHHIQESDWLSFTLCSVKDNTIKNVLRHHERWNWQRVGASQKMIPRERWIN